MTAIRQASFAGGEIAPELRARTDLQRYAASLAECRNFVATKLGPLRNRPGTTFVAAAKYADQPCILVPFDFSDDLAYVLEFGVGYARVLARGGAVVSGGAPVEFDTPYGADDLPLLKWAQVGNLLYLTCQSHPPMTLRRVDHVTWELSPLVTAKTVQPPTGLTLSREATATEDSSHPNKEWVWWATYTSPKGEQSLASAPVKPAQHDGKIDRYADRPITLTILPPAGAEAGGIVTVYCGRNDTPGYIGEVPVDDAHPTAAVSFHDDGQVPDYGDAPPEGKNPFPGPGNYPACCCIHQQRFVAANTATEPQTIFASQTGTYSAFDYSSPAKSSDACTFTVAGKRREEIRDLVSLRTLLALTASGESSVAGADGGPITPTSIDVKQQSRYGCSWVSPVVIGNAVIFVQDRGSAVRDLTYEFSSDGYVGADLTILAQHLLAGRRVVSMAYAKSPDSIVWIVRDDGVLLGLTYVREQEVSGWHVHETDGWYESVCVIPEGTEDALYAVVRRRVGGRDVRHVERFASRLEADLFLDDAIAFTAAQVGTSAELSGFGHLEGKTLTAVVDGEVVAGLVVAGGKITLPHAVAVSGAAGLPYVSRARLLPLAVQDADVRAKFKRVTKVVLELLDTRGGWAGSGGDDMTELRQRQVADAFGAPAPAQGLAEIRVSAAWERDAEAVLEQRDPLPMTVLSVTREVQVG